MYKVGDEGSLLIATIYQGVWNSVTPFSGLVYFTLDPYLNAVLSKAASSTIFWVFGMTRPVTEARAPSLTNQLEAIINCIDFYLMLLEIT